MKSDFRQIANWLTAHPKGPPEKGNEHEEAYKLVTKKYNCVRCHSFPGFKGRKQPTPTLTGYGSADWLRMMIRGPGHPRLYGAYNAMPAFRDAERLTAALEKQEYADLLKKDIKEIRFADLSDNARETLIRHFTGDDRVIFGGQSITAAPKE